MAIAKGEFRLKASQYPAEYLRRKGKEKNRRNVNEANNAMNRFVVCCGDRPPAEYSRSDINKFIDVSVKTKKTATVHRQLKSITAMFNFISLELDIKPDRLHCFQKFNIPGLGDDAESRVDFSHEQILAIRKMPPN